MQTFPRTFARVKEKSYLALWHLQKSPYLYYPPVTLILRRCANKTGAAGVCADRVLRGEGCWVLKPNSLLVTIKRQRDTWMQNTWTPQRVEIWCLQLKRCLIYTFPKQPVLIVQSRETFCHLFCLQHCILLNTAPGFIMATILPNNTPSNSDSLEFHKHASITWPLSGLTAITAKY